MFEDDKLAYVRELGLVEFRKELEQLLDKHRNVLEPSDEDGFLVGDSYIGGWVLCIASVVPDGSWFYQSLAPDSLPPHSKLGILDFVRNEM